VGVDVEVYAVGRGARAEVGPEHRLLLVQLDPVPPFGQAQCGRESGEPPPAIVTRGPSLIGP
jgi:hypothetical protein